MESLCKCVVHVCMNNSSLKLEPFSGWKFHHLSWETENSTGVWWVNFYDTHTTHSHRLSVEVKWVQLRIFLSPFENIPLRRIDSVAYRGSTHWGAPSGKVCVVTSVASFLVLGGGGARPPNVPTKNYIILRERAKRASASETYIFRTQNTSAYIYNQCIFLYGMALYLYKRYYTDKTLKLRKKSMNMRASELRKCSHFHMLKLLFPSICCWYFRYFVSET